MSQETPEIGARLVLNDAASHVLEKVKEGFAHVKEKAAEAGHEMISSFREVAQIAIGMNLSVGLESAAESMKEIAHEAINASVGQKEAERALTGVMLMTDRTGRSMEELSGQAHEVREGFEQMSIVAGASTPLMESAFAEVAERSNKSTEEVAEFTREMFYAGRAVSGGMEAISSGFSMIEMGNVRAGNSIVKLITAQHLLAGNAKQVAKQMMHMTDKERIELAEKAITKMSEKMKPAQGADLDFKQVTAALEGVREKLFNIVGNPLTDELTKQLNRLHRYFLDNQEAIERWAHEVGVKAGQWINEAADKMAEGFKYVQDHAEEIKSAIVEAFTEAKAIVQWIIDHREMIAIAFGAKIGGGMAMDAIKGGVGMAQGIAGLAKGGMTVNGMGLAPSAFAAGGGAARTGAIGALAAADVAIWGVAADQFMKLLHEWPSDEKDAQAKLAALRKDAEEGNLTEARRYAKQITDLTGDAHDAEVRQLVEKARDVKRQTDELETGARETPLTMQQDNISNMMSYFNKAADMHNAGAEDYIAKIIASNRQFMLSMDLAGDSFLKGGDELVAKVETFNHEAAQALKKLLDSARSDDAKLKQKQAAPVTNFYGAQFSIKQEFRDQDPDRVAMVFQRDILKAAESRRQGRVGTPFGL